MMIDDRAVALGAGAELLRAMSCASVSSVLREDLPLSGLVPSPRSLPSAGLDSFTAVAYSSS